MGSDAEQSQSVDLGTGKALRREGRDMMRGDTARAADFAEEVADRTQMIGYRSRSIFARADDCVDGMREARTERSGRCRFTTTAIGDGGEHRLNIVPFGGAEMGRGDGQHGESSGCGDIILIAQGGLTDQRDKISDIVRIN